MKKYIILLLLVSSFGFGQNLNQYKYAKVPLKFSILKENDQYRLNTLTKMFMEKYGFESYLDSDILPDEFANENCNKVYVDLQESNTLMMTKIKVVLKDCKNNILYVSQEGKSRDKDYGVAYNQALREAFKSFESLNHKYNINETSQKSLGMIGEPAPVKINVEKVVVTTQDVKVYTSKVDNLSLFVQPITNGFQIIDSEPKVIYKILKTSTKDFYIATKATIQGVFFSRNNEWFFEYYQNEKLVSEKVDVKF
ncbi:hypothetical protein [Flavobacterium sp.]|uniref:hypothetical protein n=1 Tax=Flavobacterium sp. TaxID=239 RepID=UPI0037537741